MKLSKLLDPELPPSKRWSAVYLGSLLGGYVLTSYAAEIAHRLAPGKPDIIVEAAPDVDEACQRFHPGEDCVPGLNHPAVSQRPDEPDEVYERMKAVKLEPIDGDEKYLDIETLAATDLD